PYQAPSTRRMAERLEKIASEADPMQNPFLNRGAAEIFRVQFEKARAHRAEPLPPATLVGLHYKYAYELLNSGASARAVEQFTALNDFIAAHRLVLDPEKAAILRLNLIMAHLRLGEQENCLSNHTSDSCLMPIQPGGVHKYPRGSREAVRLLLDQLER